MEVELNKRDYADIHRYLRKFEMMVRRLPAAEALGNAEKVQYFLKGLKKDDAKQLLAKFIVDETGEFTQDWGVVIRIVNSHMVQREAISRMEGELGISLKGEPKKEENIRNRQGVRAPEKEDPMGELTRQLAELRIQHQQLQKTIEKERRHGTAAAVMADSSGPSDRRCLYCDSTSHEKRNCARLTEHLRTGKVRVNERKRIIDPETNLELRTNIGRGGMVVFIEEKEQRSRRVPEVNVDIGDAFAITLDTASRDAVTHRKVDVNDMGKLETREDYKRVADKLREVMGWKGPVDVATIKAFHEIGVEAKRARTDVDIGDRPKLRRLRTDVGEGSSGSGGNTPNRSVDEDEIMEDAERPIAKPRKSKSMTEPQVAEEIQPTGRPEPKGKEPVRFESTIRREAEANERPTIANAHDEINESRDVRDRHVIRESRDLRDGPRFQRKSEIELNIDPDEFVWRAILDAQTTVPVKDMLAVVNPTILRAFKSKITRKNIPVGTTEVTTGQVGYDDDIIVAMNGEAKSGGNFRKNYYAKGALTIPVKIGGFVMTALLDSGSEVNLMPLSTFEELGLDIDPNVVWGIRNADTRSTRLKGVCHEVPIEIGGITGKVHIFITETCGYDLILGRPWEGAFRAQYKNLDNGSCWVKIFSQDGNRVAQLMATPPEHPHNRDRVREVDF